MHCCISGPTSQAVTKNSPQNHFFISWWWIHLCAPLGPTYSAVTYKPLPQTLVIRQHFKCCISWWMHCWTEVLLCVQSGLSNAVTQRSPPLSTIRWHCHCYTSWYMHCYTVVRFRAYVFYQSNECPNTALRSLQHKCIHGQVWFIVHISIYNGIVVNIQVFRFIAYNFIKSISW